MVNLKEKMKFGYVKAVRYAAVGAAAVGASSLALTLTAHAQSVASGTFNATDTIAVIAPAAQSFHDTFILLMEWLIPIMIVVGLILWALRHFRGMAGSSRR